MKYVSPEYETQLQDLAELLCTPERLDKNLGQLVLFELVELQPTEKAA